MASGTLKKNWQILTSRWVNLVMLNYEIDPELLSPYVPEGTTLDDWHGRTFVSIVGFRYLDTRLLRIPIPFHRTFHEVNLRFYVRRLFADGIRRGVVFIKEIVPRAAVSWVARTIYHENFVTMPMRYRYEDHASGSRSIAYQWKTKQRWNEVSVDFCGSPILPDDDSEESFMIEHYWGYSRKPDGTTMEYQVEHPRWKVCRATTSNLDCDIDALYGREFVAPLSAQPTSAFMVDGSGVVVRMGMPIN